MFSCVTDIGSSYSFVNLAVSVSTNAVQLIVWKDVSKITYYVLCRMLNCTDSVMPLMTSINNIAEKFYHSTTQQNLFNSLFSKATWVSWHQKGRTILSFNKAMMGWQWHQLDYMQIICTLLQRDNHASTLSLTFHRPHALPDAQPTVWVDDTVSSCITKWKWTLHLLCSIFIHLSAYLHFMAVFLLKLL